MRCSSVEFEIKAPLPSPGDADDLIRPLCFLKKIASTDVYFDTTQRQLFAHGVFLRVRDGQVFEIKYNPNLADLSHVSCNEHKFSWPIANEEQDSIVAFLKQFISPVNAERTADVLHDYGLKHFVEIAKERVIYIAPELEVSVDRIEGLGAFLEVEAKSESGKALVEDFCAKHHLENMPLGYVELWLRKNAFETYLKGRYILDIDKHDREGLTNAISA
jgi:predicted adenylyl cyclase CyaB